MQRICRLLEILYEMSVDMRYFKQLTIILLLSIAGEICNVLLPLPIPAAVYGLVFLLTGLISGIIKLEQVKEVGEFLLATMPVMFIPLAVRILPIWSEAQGVLLPLVVISMVGTIAVIAVTGWVTQGLMGKKGREEGE